ncbi:hypothetical protein KP509_19G006900 [Ceratopteris richardii]|nr:hypothetical protein KP509_19G006900 [Ceratopteris richardii]
MECVERVLQEVTTALEKVRACDANTAEDVRPYLSELHSALCKLAPIQELSASQKDVSVSIAKYGKVLDKFFCTDIAKAWRDVNWPDEALCRIIAIHFYRQGLFDLGDCFISEALDEEGASIREPFIEIFQILENLKMKNLEPALRWARIRHSALMQKGSPLEFELHRLQFLQLLLKGLRPEALQYARKNFRPFSDQHMAEIQRLMGCLLWTGKLESSPYSDLLSVSCWDEIAYKFIRECCSFLGQSYESPLQVTLAAGMQALPTLLKMATVLASKKQEWQLLKQLPVEIELSKEFQFHSIFACPVSKDQSTAENPPMLMPCCHVLCKQSLQKLAKNHTFKCPYCPAEVNMSQCRPIYF